MRITIQHLRTTDTWTHRKGYCAKASRVFFKRYGLSWEEFITQGIEEEKLLATGNALAINLVEFAHKQVQTQSKEQLKQAVEEFTHGR